MSESENEMQSVPFHSAFPRPDSPFPASFPAGRCLSRLEVMKRIEVREPYFALQNLSLDAAGHVHAEVPVEQPLGQEGLPLSAAEAARHLAILGSVAAAFANPKDEKFFYLAQKATLTRLGPAGFAGEALRAVACGRLTDKRTAIAQTTLGTASGNALYDLDLQYHVLAEPVFAKLFKDRQRELRNRPRERQPATPMELAQLQFLRTNPFQNPLPLYGIQINSESMSASLGQVPARYCAGHFPFYPALPVAVLASCLSNMAGHLLRFRQLSKSGFAYVVTHSLLQADNMAFAGDEVTLSARHVDSEGKNHRFHCEAFTALGVPVGDLQIMLTEMEG